MIPEEWAVIHGAEISSDVMRFEKTTPFWELNIKITTSKKVPVPDLVKLLMEHKDRTFMEELSKYIMYMEEEK